LFGQGPITVRFVDYRSGKPISRVGVLATVWNGESLATFSWKAEMRAKTNKGGVIRVPLPRTLPEHLDLSSFDTLDPLSVDLPIEKILQSGITVVINAHHSLDPQSRPADTAGQVVVVTRKRNANDRIAREFP
jgi:hypothetical protein